MSRPPNLFHYSTLGGRVIKYAHAGAWQQAMVTDFLAHKAAVSKQELLPATKKSSVPEAPTPSILTFSPLPVYTTGRRDKDGLSPEQVDKLKKPFLRTSKPPAIADVISTLRGGQTTFHGPGQVVIYPILDLRAIRTEKWPQGLSVRCYVNLLEETTIKTIAKWGINGVRTENPGVWVTDGPKGERKIAALGVHLRRNITSFGVGLNVTTDLRWFDRIVACGLPGKGTTRMMDEIGPEHKSTSYEIPSQITRINWPSISRLVADMWVEEFVKGIWGPDGTYERVGVSKAPHGEIFLKNTYFDKKTGYLHLVFPRSNGLQEKGTEAT